jgi:hypothetical protein
MGSIPGWSILFAPVFGKDYIFLIIFRRKLWYLAVIPVFFLYSDIQLLSPLVFNYVEQNVAFHAFHFLSWLI